MNDEIKHDDDVYEIDINNAIDDDEKRHAIERRDERNALIIEYCDTLYESSCNDNEIDDCILHIYRVLNQLIDNVLINAMILHAINKNDTTHKTREKIHDIAMKYI